MIVAVGGKVAGLLGVADPIKPTTPEAIEMLHSEKLRVVMLTGRQPHHGRSQQVEAKHRRGDCRGPARAERRGRSPPTSAKVGEWRWQATESTMLPLWRRPTWVLRWGQGRTWRWKAAAVTLVKGDLRGIVRAKRLSQQTSAAIRQNLFLAFVYNAISVPLAAFGIVSPMCGPAAAMSLSMVSVIVNSLRLRKAKLLAESSLALTAHRGSG